MAGTRLGEILLRLGYVSEDDVKNALVIQKDEGGARKLGEILTELFIKNEHLTQALTLQMSGTVSDPGIEIVSRILKQRLGQSDIKDMLASLSSQGPDNFMDSVAEVLEKVTSFLDVSSRLSNTLSLDDLLQSMMAMLTDALDADRSTLFLNDTRTDELFSRVIQGKDVREIRFPNTAGIAGSVFTKDTSVIIDDPYNDPRFNQEVDRKTGYRTRSILCAPIHSREGETLGVAQVLNKKAGCFNADDLLLVEVMTSQAASAIQNATLFDQVTKARDEEHRLLEVTTAIASELHLDELLKKIMSTTTDILDADRSTLFMHDSKTNELWSLVLQGDNINEIRFPSHLGIAGSVFTSRETVNIPDAYADQRFNQAVDKKTGYRTRNILCMPVINKNGRAIGVIQVLNKNGGSFTQIDENRLRAFSSQASIAIENAQLFEEVLRVKNYNESILKSLSNGVITLDWDGNVVKVNQAAGAILMIPPTEAGALMGTPVGEMFSGPNSWIAESVATVVKSGEQHIVMDGEYLAHGKDRISMNLTTVPLVDMNQERVGTMLVIEDITKEKRLKGTMARYMTKEVAERLLEGGESLLGGQMHAATVLFSDIRGFTTISEKIGATRTVEMLNEYFTLMVDVLFKHNGVLDKYVGDAIMAVFGVPFTADDDADRAARASIEMLRTLREFNIHRAEVGDDIINIGIGLNTDDVLSGNIGSLKRMDYTVIGDGVNLASRLESANKYYGSNILLSEFTFSKLKDTYHHRKVDNIKVKGKNKPVSVYQLLDFHTDESFPHMQDVLALYTEGLDLYHKRNWAEAVRKFRAALELNPQDRLSDLYIERCRHFMKTPPTDDWDGVWIMTSK